MNRNYPGSRPFEERGSRTQPPILSDEEIRAVVVEGSVEKLVEFADKVGKNLKEQNLTTSQMRNVFGTARQIQFRWITDAARSYRDAVLLIPKLGYYAEREKSAKGGRSSGMETLQHVLEPALKLMQGGQNAEEQRLRYERIMEFFEAIVAYHKSYGGK